MFSKVLVANRGEIVVRAFRAAYEPTAATQARSRPRSPGWSASRWPRAARGIYAGRLRNARQVEALTVNLVSVNRRYKAHAGVRVTDV
jgi:hypothetical protein